MRLLHLIRGERVVGCTIRERERKRLLAFADTLLIADDVEEAHICEELAAGRLDALLDGLCRDILVDDDCKVNRDARERRHLLIGQLALGKTEQRLDRELERHDILLDLEVLKDLRMDVADPADELSAVGVDFGSAARLEPPILFLICHLVADLRDAQRLQELLDDTDMTPQTKRGSSGWDLCS